jgi:hypothetical protein
MPAPLRPAPPLASQAMRIGQVGFCKWPQVSLRETAFVAVCIPAGGVGCVVVPATAQTGAVAQVASTGEPGLIPSWHHAQTRIQSFHQMPGSPSARVD